MKNEKPQLVNSKQLEAILLDRGRRLSEALVIIDRLKAATK